MKRFLVVLIIYSFCHHCNAQISCTKEMLLGRWREAASTWTGMISNDSLKSLAELSTKTLRHFSFNHNDTFTRTFQSEGQTKEFTRQYKFDASACELILGLERKRVRENKVPRSKLEIMYIVYLDDKILIYEAFDNPKGYTSHALVRED